MKYYSSVLNTIEKVHKLLWEIGNFGVGWGRESEKKMIFE